LNDYFRGFLSLASAISAVDAATHSGAAYFMVNCAHPDHFTDVLQDEPWARRIRGIRCNASRQSHAELDACDTLTMAIPWNWRISTCR